MPGRAPWEEEERAWQGLLQKYAYDYPGRPEYVKGRYGEYVAARAQWEAARAAGLAEEAEKLGLSEEGRRKDYKVSADTLALIESVRQTADSKGRIKPGERAVEALKSKFNYNASVCPAHYRPEGGFSKDKE